ncbi:trimeric intracellular cation channel family protein [Nostocoides sp. F2B08]|uniref:trimeric intracellular cation channel family protein n=1 Tax=Nostocoides sp. F2B08 TaxID=2653936 RepID=UPI001262FF1C|nr:trimeric intracellular cation channel family protein [Tetrasphaera sp. F2B08]KAB7746111.1 trimeric intracellular cation channel family protein [Tetrasphaera sp. F2B08]
MVTSDASVQVALDIIGVFVFALSGGLVALRARLDLFGVLVLAWVTGLGGGIIRDLLLGATPPVGISDWRLVLSGLLAGLLVFTFHGRLRAVARRRPRRVGLVSRLVKILDAGGLALFAVSGSLKAIQLDSPWLAAVIVGGVTAIGGGMIRDVLARQVPEVLQRELYAVPAFAGAALVVGLDRLGWLNPVTTWLCVALIFMTRMVAVALDLNVPRSRAAEPP